VAAVFAFPEIARLKEGSQASEMAERARAAPFDAMQQDRTQPRREPAGFVERGSFSRPPPAFPKRVLRAPQIPRQAAA